MMKSSINIFPMTLQDVDIVINIQNEDNLHIISKNSLINDLDNSNYNYFILKVNDTTCGFIGTSKSFDTMDILSVVIAKEYRKNGLASTLLEYIFKLAKESNIEKIFLEVRKSNLPAQNLYLKSGFSHINTRKNYYPDNLEDAYIFLKELS